MRWCAVTTPGTVTPVSRISSVPPSRRYSNGPLYGVDDGEVGIGPRKLSDLKCVVPRTPWLPSTTPRKQNASPASQPSVTRISTRSAWTDLHSLACATNAAQARNSEAPDANRRDIVRVMVVFWIRRNRRRCLHAVETTRSVRAPPTRHAQDL